MSFSSKVAQPSIRISISEVDSSGESLESNGESSPFQRFNARSMSISSPIEHFRRSLQNEREIRKHLTKLEGLPLPKGLRNEKTMEIMEKNYKLQIQTLLEEVNQLKLEKKILEKKMERSYREGDTPKNRRIDSFADNFDESIMKKTIETKASTISQLEFQLAKMRQENTSLKLKLDSQSRQMEELFRRITDAENFKEVLEEKDEEITILQRTLKAEELKHEKMSQELSYFKNENIALKLKTFCSNCGQPGAGAISFINPHCNCGSKDLSFFSSIDKCGHYRPSVGKILNFSELNDDLLKAGNLNSPNEGKSKFSLSHRSRETTGDDTNRTKSEFGQLQNLSVKVLCEYEEGIKKDKKKVDCEKDAKTLERIIEVKKIKSYVLEEQNKKLLSMLKVGAAEKAMTVEAQHA